MKVPGSPEREAAFDDGTLGVVGRQMGEVPGVRKGRWSRSLDLTEGHPRGVCDAGLRHCVLCKSCPRS
jgi:hypothetical protein